MSKQTKDERIVELGQQLTQALTDKTELALQLDHIGDFARGVGYDSLDQAPTEFNRSGWSEELDVVAETVRMLHATVHEGKVANVQLQAKNLELRADIEQKQKVLGLQAKEIERLALQVQTVASGLKRRHDAIEAVLSVLGHDFDPHAENEIMTDDEEILFRHILKTANVG